MKEAKRLWSWLAIPCIALAVLTGSILPVLLVRGFYTVQIGPLGICEASGLTRRQAAEAYGDVMDYCMGRRPDFAAGVLPFSAEGADHFADVRGLFLLVVWVFVAAAGLLLAGTVVCRLRRQRLPRLGGRTPGFWAACGLGGLFLLIALLAALNFDRAFTVFHSIFFPGKDNWLFDPVADPVILILPEAFFRNCAIAIVTVLLTVCIVLVVTGRKDPPAGVLRGGYGILTKPCPLDKIGQKTGPAGRPLSVRRTSHFVPCRPCPSPLRGLARKRRKTYESLLSVRDLTNHWADRRKNSSAVSG
ncbi:MAG: TIGR01906 family membrane protein [Oscillospiraceae bacterium]